MLAVEPYHVADHSFLTLYTCHLLTLIILQTYEIKSNMANIPTYVYKYMKNVINLRKILYLCNGYCARWMVGQTNKKGTA
jgi:hypothetical protein